MTRGQIGLAIYARGVAVFVVGLTGFAQARAPYASVLGVVVTLAGFIVFLRTLNSSLLSRPHAIVAIVTALAVALHVYENVFKSSLSFSPGWLLWALMPYALCLAVSAYSDTRIAAIAGATMALVLDLLTYYDVFVHPTGSTGALALIYVPLWNTLIVAPVAIYFAWLVLRRRGHRLLDAR